MWITQPQAAEILGCHVSLIGKLVAKGELTSRGQGPKVDADAFHVVHVDVLV